MKIPMHILTDFKAGRIAGFYTSVYPSLLTYAARCLGSEMGFLAEDCVQDAVFTAYSRKESFRSPVQFGSFLYTCVHNNSISVLRRNQISEKYTEQNGERYESDFTNSIIEQETLDLLYEAIGQLPEELRQVFELSFEQGLRNNEVAAILNLSESAVKKRKARMIALLRERFIANKAMLSLFSTMFVLN